MAGRFWSTVYLVAGLVIGVAIIVLLVLWMGPVG